MAREMETLLAKAADAGVYRLSHHDVGSLQKSARGLGFAWLQTDLGGQRKRRPALEKLGKDLNLPTWYGANFDALADCLSDLSWQEAPGYVLLVAGTGELRGGDPEAFDTLKSVFADIVEAWRENEKPFWVLFIDLDGGELAPLPA